MDEMQPSTEEKSSTSRALRFLAFASGFAALSYEVLALRAITTLLGDTFLVHGSVLATYMLGLGAGSRIAPLLPRALAPAELATGLWGMAFPALVVWLKDHPALMEITSGRPAMAAASALLVAAPAFLVGLTLPLFTARLERCGHAASFAGVYAFHGMGGAASILLVELVLLRQLGLATTLRTVALVNLIVAVSVWRLEGHEDREAPDPVPQMSPTLAVALVLASGASAAHQMLALKLGYLVFLPHRENVAVILSLSVAGLAMGSFLVRRFTLTFATLVAWVPFVLAITFTGYPALLAAYLLTTPPPEAHGILFLLHKLFFAAMLTLPVSALFGGLIPALTPPGHGAARSAATMLGLSSAANAAGYLIWALALHPHLPVSGVCAVISITCWISAALAEPRLTAARTGLLAAGALALATLFATWDEADFYYPGMAFRRGSADEVITLKSGPDSATILRGISQEILSYNGHQDIQIQCDGRVNHAEMMSGVIAALASPRRGRALVIGLGTGITAGTVARLFESTDIVEINPAFLDLVPILTHVNMGLAGNERARLHVADGRAFLTGREQAYDAIVVSSPPPRYFAAAKLFTREFYTLARGALRPGGVLAVWVSAGDMNASGIRSLIRTLEEVFPHGTLWLLREGYYQLVVSAEPETPRRLADLAPIHPLLARELEVSLGPARESRFDQALLTTQVLEAFEDPLAPVSTDDLPVLEFSTARGFETGMETTDPIAISPAEFGISESVGAGSR